MKLKIIKELKEGAAIVTVNVVEPEVGNYLKAVEAFGEEPINIGGEIKDETGEATLASLADRYVKVTDIIDEPIVMSFQKSQYTDNTEKVANKWANDVVKKIDEYVEEMSKSVDIFSGTTIIDI